VWSPDHHHRYDNEDEDPGKYFVDALNLLGRRGKHNLYPF